MRPRTMAGTDAYGARKPKHGLDEGRITAGIRCNFPFQDRRPEEFRREWDILNWIKTALLTRV